MPRIFGREVPAPVLAGVAVVGVVLLALWARRRSPAAAAQAAEPEALQAAQEALGGAAGAQASYADAAYNLEIQARQQELAFRQGQFERASKLEEKQAAFQGSLLDWLTGKGKRPAAVKCPSGQPRFDPSTGQVYCRQQESHGFFGDLLTGAFGSPSLGNAVGKVGASYLPHFPAPGDIQP